MKSVPWLRHQNREGRNIYVRPKGEHNLSMVDDLTADAVSTMRQAGFNPAVIVETSPGNYQAWLKHPEPLSKQVSTAAAKALAEKFGGDRGAADWRHFGRLAGFCNRKAKYRDANTELYPFVCLIEVWREGLSRGGAIPIEREKRPRATEFRAGTVEDWASRLWARDPAPGSKEHRCVPRGQSLRKEMERELILHTPSMPYRVASAQTRLIARFARAICRTKGTNDGRMIT